MTGGVAVAQPGVGRLQSLLPDVTVGGVVVDALEGGAAGGGVARAPKNERILFCALIASYGPCLVPVQMASSKHARARARKQRRQHLRRRHNAMNTRPLQV